MSGVEGGGVNEVAERLGRLCVQADEAQLREYAERFGAAGVLLGVVTALRHGGSRDPDILADLDRLDDAFARNGVDGLTTGARGYEPWRIAGSHAVVAVWVCPAARSCSRMVSRDGVEQPHCGLIDAPFRSDRIHL
jgi:hypothetical protein